MNIEYLALDPRLVKTLDFLLSIFFLILRSTTPPSLALQTFYGPLPFYRFDLVLDKKIPILYADELFISLLFDACTFRHLLSVICCSLAKSSNLMYGQFLGQFYHRVRINQVA